MTTLSFVVGDLNSKKEVMATHTKCLVCDKPVNLPTPDPKLSSPTVHLSKSLNQIGYDKLDDDSITSLESERPMIRVGTASGLGRNLPTSSSSLSRLRSADHKISGREKTRISTEITVLKNSVDLLPSITSSVTLTLHT